MTIRILNTRTFPATPEFNAVTNVEIAISADNAIWYALDVGLTADVEDIPGELEKRHAELLATAMQKDKPLDPTPFLKREEAQLEWSRSRLSGRSAEDLRTFIRARVQGWRSLDDAKDDLEEFLTVLMVNLLASRE